MTKEMKILPKVSFKGAFVFMIILFLGILLIPRPLILFGIPVSISYFISAGVSSSVGLSIILTKIDGKPEEKPYFKKRILISIIVGFATSALMVFVFGGDVIG